MTPITYLVGDATYPEGPGLKIIAHCCNNRGIWGAGFVLAVSKRWSAPEEVFMSRHLHGRDSLGSFQISRVEDDILVANIIGQEGVGLDHNGRPPVRYGALRDGFRDMAEAAVALINPVPTIHMPRLGCGLAGGQWSMVETILFEELSSRDVRAFVYDLPARTE